MKQRPRIKKTGLALLALLLLAANISPALPRASAGTLTNSYIELNRMAAGATTSFRLVFKTVGSGATTVAVNFNGADTTTWTGSSGVVNTTQPVSSASCAAATGATALPGGSLLASGTGSTVTITGVTALSATTAYCVDLTSATAVTDATANEYHPTITAGSDSTTVAVRTVSNDQIVVSATVPPTFNFAITGGNTDSFTANLNPGAVGVTSGKTFTVNTNAKNGWFAWASDSSTGLTSASASHTIASTTPGSGATLSSGTEGYVLGVTSLSQGTGGGTESAVAAYSSNGTSTGSGLDATLRQIVSSNGTANTATFTLKELAAISPVTQPGTDYTDTITVIGAGYF